MVDGRAAWVAASTIRRSRQFRSVLIPQPAQPTANFLGNKLDPLAALKELNLVALRSVDEGDDRSV